jgi:hypothetical protein
MSPRLAQLACRCYQTLDWVCCHGLVCGCSCIVFTNHPMPLTYSILTVSSVLWRCMWFSSSIYCLLYPAEHVRTVFRSGGLESSGFPHGGPTAVARPWHGAAWPTPVRIASRTYNAATNFSPLTTPFRINSKPFFNPSSPAPTACTER